MTVMGTVTFRRTAYSYNGIEAEMRIYSYVYIFMTTNLGFVEV